MITTTLPAPEPTGARLSESSSPASEEQPPNLAAASAATRQRAQLLEQLRTTLALILGSLRELRYGLHGPLPAAAAAELERAERNAARTPALLDRLLDPAGLDDGSEQDPEATTPTPTPDELDRVMAKAKPMHQSMRQLLNEENRAGSAGLKPARGPGVARSNDHDRAGSAGFQPVRRERSPPHDAKAVGAVAGSCPGGTFVLPLADE